MVAPSRPKSLSSLPVYPPQRSAAHYPLHPLRPLCSGLSDLCVALFPAFEHSTSLLPITSLQPQQFHAITHSFAQRRSAIPRIFNGFRTLSITTGAYPSVIPGDRLSGFQRVNSLVYKSLVPLCRLFALFSAFGSLVFNFAASFPKTPGGWVHAFQPPPSSFQFPRLRRAGAA